MLLYTFRKPLGSLADVRLHTGARILVNDVTFRNYQSICAERVCEEPNAIHIDVFSSTCVIV